MIYLYRGDLHKVSDTPRQWTVPTSQIPVSVFRKALKKRNAALSKCLQFYSLQTADANATSNANETAESSGLNLVKFSGGLERLSPESGGGKEVDGRPEIGVGLSDGRRAECKEQMDHAEDESERRKDRKRRREKDVWEGSGRYLERKEEAARRDGGDVEAASRGKYNILLKGSEAIIVDTEAQPSAINCSVRPAEKTVPDCDETMADSVKVRVSEIGTSHEMESKHGNEVGLTDESETQRRDVGHLGRNVDLVQLEATGKTMPNFEETKSKGNVLANSEENGKDGGRVGSEQLKVIGEKVKKREELEAKLEKLRAEKHRLVLRLKQVLNEEEVKKRVFLASGSPASLLGAAVGPFDSSVPSTNGEKHGVGVSYTAADLEEGELEYARTPSPPAKARPSVHGSLSGHSSVPVTGRKTSLAQHLSQSASGRGGYYAHGLGVSPSPAAPDIAGGALSPGTGLLGNLPSPLGSHSFSHNMALQHAAAIHAQKVTSIAPGPGQFSSIPPSGGLLGAGTGAMSGPPGFCGYSLSPSLHSHHSHLSQSASSSSLPHMAGQQGVGSSSLLTTPRGPPGYHDIRMGGPWIQR